MNVKCRHVSALLAAFLLLGLFTGCASDPDPERPLTPEQELEKKELERLVRLFIANHEEWPQARDQAMQDPRMSEMLLDNLVIKLVDTSRNRHNKGLPLGSWSPYRRCRDELVLLADQAIPKLIRLHQVVHSRERVDPVVLFPVQDTLMAIGGKALGQLFTRYGEASDRRERESLLKIVAGTASLDALAFLEGRLRDDDWQIRSRVIEGLGQIGAREEVDAATRARCRSLLARVLASDQDAFCRIQAARGLGALADVESVRVLLKHYRDFSLQSGGRRTDERGHLLDALRRATREFTASTVEEFEAWLERQEAESGT